ncbi:zinc-dependent peptidase [Reichenbachiella carrageenanivorans]|uniref:Zinc-dependent peptidase n=1 Tax=Reichenbachiella carrageenanivorans TaxID=2979869 RepID=A0ABY6D3J6_9BACT|nr:zinc-dependent peptidase [Reichenbachiella carrageenanivorans]UXX79633.1 zinc-dependent peptidase [Reichenbachiella carrageenanivorans]
MTESSFALLLQADPPANSFMDVVVMAFLSVAVIVLAAITGRINMGFRVPGFSQPLSSKRKEILKKHFPFYNSLSANKQKRFEQKVKSFIVVKEFIPRQMPGVTEEMKVLISACAVQLTFGFPKVFLSHFKRILIYPDNYYSTINKTYHKGEVNPRYRAIVLSWKAFVEGYFDQSDGRNVGLHEMAHALRLENLIWNGEYDFLDPDLLARWQILADQEMINIAHGKSRLFREYAGTDPEEFFSVAVENFFERPEKFKSHMPNLYAILVLLLKQDPLNSI